MSGLLLLCGVFALVTELLVPPPLQNQAQKLWLISLWIPLATVVGLGALFPLATSAAPRNGAVHNAHAGACAVLVALGLSELVTQTAKFYVGRLRPNFYAMCGFSEETLECTHGGMSTALLTS